MSNCVCSGKDSATRVKSKTNNKVFVFFSEPPPIFGGAKDSANRTEYEIKKRIFCFYS